jgi:hypothetical protein
LQIATHQEWEDLSSLESTFRSHKKHAMSSLI